MNKIIQRYTPNMMTFISMGCGLISIILSSQDLLWPAGLLIIASVILDSLDGFAARQLKVSSVFGKQLDSLVDVVSFGVAPIMLFLAHLHLRGDYRFWLLPLAILYLWAGAFRLARFNLESNPKENGESTGLTITQAGLIIALAVLSDLVQPDHALPLGVYIMTLVVLGYMMTSRIKFPGFAWFVPTKWAFPLYVVIAGVLFFATSVFKMILVFCLGILAASICRHVFFSNRIAPGIPFNK